MIQKQKSMAKKEKKVKKYEVDVTRIGIASATFTVKAR